MRTGGEADDMELVTGGNDEGRAGDGWVCSLLSLSRPISLRSAWKVWVCGDQRRGGCLFVEISVCGGQRHLWLRLRGGSRWLLSCGIDESMVGLWKLMTGLWESVDGLWDSVSGLCGFGFVGMDLAVVAVVVLLDFRCWSWWWWLLCCGFDVIADRKSVV